MKKKKKKLLQSNTSFKVRSILKGFNKSSNMRVSFSINLSFGFNINNSLGIIIEDMVNKEINISNLNMQLISM